MVILTAPHPMLNTICRRDFVVTLEQITEMFALMRANRGLGLAAPQVGIPARLFITAWGQIFINPRIVDHWPTKQIGVEGCLSLPGRYFSVPRWRWIRLNSGEEFSGDKAVIIQHELDHLNGTLISDIGDEQK